MQRGKAFYVQNKDVRKKSGKREGKKGDANSFGLLFRGEVLTQTGHGELRGRKGRLLSQNLGGLGGVPR